MSDDKNTRHFSGEGNIQINHVPNTSTMTDKRSCLLFTRQAYPDLEVVKHTRGFSQV